MLPVSITLVSCVVPRAAVPGIISHHSYRRFTSWSRTRVSVPYFRWSNTHCQDRLMDSSRRLSSGEPCGDNTEHIDEEYPRIMERLQQVNSQNLTEAERAIHERHVVAMETKNDFYIDPATGYQVMTSLAHLKRGSCCGNECRHCPYSHTNVPDAKKTKIFNGSFYV
ncbi:uncharacterized protein LOC124275893 [Haliotis rubra]|uniref:uncharacterized protein LOC124275893 n=1 Tax=Haliotis rubra TaxID=36100 RepID=UPI001EE59FD9|nr:uncharacterized protein LOC124275893 [Haliotis rubra]